jgi:hypothetical protein
MLVLATSRPQHDLPASSVPGATGGAAHSLSAKNVNLYRSLLKLPGISKLFLEPFNFMQTRALMKVSTLPFENTYCPTVLRISLLAMVGHGLRTSM